MFLQNFHGYTYHTLPLIYNTMHHRLRSTVPATSTDYPPCLSAANPFRRDISSSRFFFVWWLFSSMSFPHYCERTSFALTIALLLRPLCDCSSPSLYDSVNRYQTYLATTHLVSAFVRQRPPLEQLTFPVVAGEKRCSRIGPRENELLVAVLDLWPMVYGEEQPWYTRGSFAKPWYTSQSFSEKKKYKAKKSQVLVFFGFLE